MAAQGNAEKFARVLAVLAVLAVAVVAGIVSFSHIESLALAHGYSTGTASILPVSVDGLIVASSLALLTEARARHPQPGLARAGLILGILATLAANVAAGAQFGIVGALVNVWPGVAFVVASEILLRMIRATRDVPSAKRAEQDSVTEAPIPVALPLETVADVPRAVPADVLPDVPLGTPVATPSVPQDGPEDASLAVPADVPRVAPVAPLRPKPATSRRTAKRPVARRVFAAELRAGELPSLRSIKTAMHCGTDRARVIRDQLAEILQEVPEAA